MTALPELSEFFTDKFPLEICNGSPEGVPGLGDQVNFVFFG